MLSVFIVSAVVHEYALAMGFGFFYPVMFCLFAVFGGEEIYFNMQRLGLGNKKYHYASSDQNIIEKNSNVSWPFSSEK